MSARLGGLPRGVCDVCGEDVALLRDGKPIAHGPNNNRCSGGTALEVRLGPALWDRLTGRLTDRAASIDQRMRNATDVCAAARAAAHPHGDTLDDEQLLWQARRTTEPWLRGAP